MCTFKKNIDYIICDCKMRYFVCGEGVTFHNVIIRRPRWPYMEKTHAYTITKCGCNSLVPID